MQKGIVALSVINQNVLVRIIMLSSMEKLLWPTNWFWYKTIRRNKKDNYRARWTLYYRVFVRLWIHQKSFYRLIVVDLSRQKELDADLKAIQQIEFVGQIKNAADRMVDGETMFGLAILEKIKETRLKFSQGSVTVNIKNGKLWRSNS